MIIDAHQHYWKLARGDYGWLSPDSEPVLYRDYMPENLKTELERCGVAGTIVVQAAPTMEETEYMLQLCEQEPSLLGVVGWLDVNSTDFEQHYRRFRTNPRFVGIRPQLPQVPDGDWSKYPQICRNLWILAEDGFPVDLLIRPSQLPEMVKLMVHVPKLAVIIDHLAFPNIGGSDIEDWLDGLMGMAKFKSVHCKLSSLATGIGGCNWKASDLTPYVHYAYQAFGPERILFGSDWPVCLQAGGFEEMLELARASLPPNLTVAEHEAIFGGNAIRVYRLPLKSGGGTNASDTYCRL